MPVTDYFKKWDDTKKEYEALVHKKPRKKILFIFSVAHTGLSKPLKKTREALTGIESAMAKGDMKAAAKSLAALRAAVADFLKAKDNYTQQLDKAIQAEKEMNKDEKSVQERGLKFLKKELQAIASELEGEIAIIEEVVESGAKAEEADAALLASWKKSIKSSIDRAMAEIAKVKADPTVADYNARIWKAARNLAPELTRARQVPNVPDPRNLERELAPYIASTLGPPAQLPDTTTTQQVQGEVKTFSNIIKRVAALVAHA